MCQAPCPVDWGADGSTARESLASHYAGQTNWLLSARWLRVFVACPGRSGQPGCADRFLHGVRQRFSGR